MSIGEDLRTHLLGTTDITVVVGQRVHQSHMPEESDYPAIWFQRMAEDEGVCMDGRDSTINTRFDLECIATDMDTALDLGKTVKDYLHGSSGTLAGTTSAVQGLFVENKDDDYLPRNEGSDDGRIVVALDISVWST